MKNRSRQGNPEYTCTTCGKRGYNTRKGARDAARRKYPSQKMREYQCGGVVAGGGSVWHLTRFPRQQESAS